MPKNSNRLESTLVAQGVALPRWDSAARRLWLGDRLLMDFRQPAPYQTAVLDAFEAQGWQSGHVLVSLQLVPGETADDLKQHLRDAIRNLNRKLPRGTIHFRGDGTARGVWWERGGKRRRAKRKRA
jgi:hypothetical protein